MLPRTMDNDNTMMPAPRISKEVSRQAVETMLYYLYELELTEGQRRIVLDMMFGGRSKPGNLRKKNSALVDARFIERYGQLRALGMDQHDAATMLGITSFRLEELLAGDGLSDDVHQALLFADTLGAVQLKYTCLSTIRNAVELGDWRAAVAMLEKQFPDRYGKRLAIDSKMDAKWSSQDCEDNAVKAHSELARIRQARSAVHAGEMYVDA